MTDEERRAYVWDWLRCVKPITNVRKGKGCEPGQSYWFEYIHDTGDNNEFPDAEDFYRKLSDNDYYDEVYITDDELVNNFVYEGPMAMEEKDIHGIANGATLFIADGNRQVTAKCEAFNIKVKEDALPDGSERWRMPRPITLTAEGNVLASSTGLESLLPPSNGKVKVNIIPDGRHLPRKWKKAVRANYRRDTKWKRKAVCWLKHNEVCLTGYINYDEDRITVSGQPER